MTTSTIVYGEPQVERRVNKSSGVVNKIFEYKFSHYSESVPGSDKERSGAKTTLRLVEDNGLERQLDFDGFIGREVIGERVDYEEVTEISTTFFDPTGRENDPLYRRGKKEIKKVCRLSPQDKSFPPYVSEEISQHSLF